MRRPFRLLLPLLVLAAAPAVAGPYTDLEKCYQANGQLEETQTGNKKVTTYKSEAEVAEGCNEKVVAKAKGAKDAKTVGELATIVGRNSNWQSALAVYVAGVKGAGKKGICDAKDARDAAHLALSSPKDHPHSTNALAFYGACWPESKEDVVDQLTPEADSYHKEHLCAFLAGKKALPADKAAVCKGS